MTYKFCYQPNTKEYFEGFTSHTTMILGRRRNFCNYVRGIILIYKNNEIIYLRGHENKRWLEKTKKFCNKKFPGTKVVYGSYWAEKLRRELGGL